ncbi:hypothetical protein MC7420_4835 [Coleofasciculus chthonoplastes PCC 7420]|uniref:Uncharacterized protein n=1 Tax=Coleofasciculus chthonoplastes PCC 7420 TaxID=118168 RepID=B4VNL3_9CYAN|nr:hypothetical protein MC7420_4835 [Coleofasciculus chthonoplastes PCC 7420]
MPIANTGWRRGISLNLKMFMSQSVTILEDRTWSCCLGSSRRGEAREI